MEFDQTIINGIAIIIGVVVILYFVPLGPWLKAMLSGHNFPFEQLFYMRLRKSPIKSIIEMTIMANNAGIPLEPSQIEMHAICGGDIFNVVTGMIRAKEAGLKISFQNACGADLMGIDLADAVQERASKRESENNIFEP